MGVINAENNLSFKSSDFLFARIKKRLRSFDAEGLIDDGDFSKHVIYMLEQLGRAVYKECEAVIPVVNFKAKLPFNFKYFFSAYRCSFTWKKTKSINEQRPWIYQFDTEITKDVDCCEINCCKDEDSKTKVVIRTFVNGDEDNCGTSNDLCLLKLSPNVKDVCTEDCLNLFCPGDDEVTLDTDEKILHTMFTDDNIFIQYYGVPVDKYGLPMIPDNEDIEKAIEYYIYTQLFEEFYWNKEVVGIERMLADVRDQYDNKYLPQARYWAKLPSFQRMINSIRRQRSMRKFYYSINDRTQY